MARRKQPFDTTAVHTPRRKSHEKQHDGFYPFHYEPLTDAQKLAWEVYQQSSVLFLVGAAGSGKSFLATVFSVREIIARQKSKIILCRPIIEAGEHLGFLPGDIGEKIDPYMAPLYDCVSKIAGKNYELKEFIEKSYEIKPLAFMRGCTFDDSVCILDEAQNCTKAQLKLFLTRMGKNSRMIITGDPSQSDLGRPSELMEIATKLTDLDGVGLVYFNEDCNVRHPLVTEFIKRL